MGNPTAYYDHKSGVFFEPTDKGVYKASLPKIMAKAFELVKEEDKEKEAKWRGNLSDTPVRDVWGNQQGTLKDYPKVMSQVYQVKKEEIQPVAMAQEETKPVTERNWRNKHPAHIEYVLKQEARIAEQKKQGFWERLNKACEERDVPIDELASKAGITPTTIAGYSTGVLPRLPNLIKLSTALNVSMDYLMLGEEKPSPSESKKEEPEPKQTIDTSKFIDGERFYQRMRGLAGIETSRRTRNIEMTKLMCRLLKEMGYGKATDLFEKTVFSDN